MVHVCKEDVAVPDRRYKQQQRMRPYENAVALYGLQKKKGASGSQGQRDVFQRIETRPWI